MKKETDLTYRRLRTEYVAYWATSLLLAIGFESGLLPEGLWAGDARLQYIGGTIGVMATLTVVPTALKLYAYTLRKHAGEAPTADTLRRYRCWNTLRLGMLAAVTWTDITVYYLTLDNIGGLCALITLTASLFCLPGREKITEELNIKETTEP